MADKTVKPDTSFTQNRELSWLRFNERVLEEADDETVPLYERLKFAAIFTSNLDEFFMIRVGSLYDLSLLKQVHIDNKSGMTPEEQLHAIYAAVSPLYKRRDRIMEEIEGQFRLRDIANVTFQELVLHERRFLQTYYDTAIRPILSPQVVDASHPFPHLINKALYIAVRFKGKGKEKNERFGLIPLPDALPRLILLPGNSTRYILTEQVLLEYAEDIFSMYTVSDKTILTVTRNADINPDDENFEVDDDYRHHMKQVLKKRARLACVRLELGSDCSPELRDFFMRRLFLKKEQVFKCSTPLNMSYVYSLSDHFTPASRRQLTYRPFSPCASRMVVRSDSMIKQVLRQELFLSYPYESMEPFLQLIREAAYDPSVISIKITIYRLASKSRLIEYLSAAAENGKDVLVLMELRARFDEENNINWSENLEDAGCKVIYGMEDFKVHSKICLITRRDRGKVQYITQIGTGNYNEKTASLYTDFCLMTADNAIGSDASEFFKNMALSNLDGEYHDLLVAPHSLKNRLIEQIDRLIVRAKSGRTTRLIIKTNSVTDRELIDKLSEASGAGVRIDLIVRGICCILPQIPGKTENITVTSVVGRFLEHSRVYCFMDGGDYELYISSADFMTRNTTRRVEIRCPVKNAQIKARILHFLEMMLSDNVKARHMLPDGNYLPVSNGESPLSCQEFFMQEAERHRHDEQEKKSSFLSKWFSKRK